jgi:type I restriction enzyme, S subunit
LPNTFVDLATLQTEMLTLKEQTMLGSIPAEWTAKPLKSLLAEDLAGDWGEDHGPHVVSVLRSTNITNDCWLDLSDVVRRALRPEKAILLTPRAGDILLERSGGGPDQPVGRVAFVEADMPGHAFSNFLHLLRPDKNVISDRYLGWVLHHINRTGRISRLEQQTTQMRNLHFRDYLTMVLPVPSSLDEQAAIARILDAVDTVLRRMRAAVERAQELERACLEEAFDNLEAPQRPLGEFTIDVRYGTSKASSDRGWGNPVLGIPNVTGDRLSLSDLAFVELPAADVDRLRLNDGDLLLVRTNGNPNYVGRSVVFRHPDARTWVYASYLIRVRLRDGLLPEFVNVFLGLERGRRELLRRVTTSAGNHNINSNSIRLLKLPAPASNDVQARIVEVARACRAHVDAARAKIAALEVLQKSLMHDLLTGHVRVRSGTKAAAT